MVREGRYERGKQGRTISRCAPPTTGSIPTDTHPPPADAHPPTTVGTLNSFTQTPTHHPPPTVGTLNSFSEQELVDCTKDGHYTCNLGGEMVRRRL